MGYDESGQSIPQREGAGSCSGGEAFGIFDDGEAAVLLQGVDQDVTEQLSFWTFRHFARVVSLKL